MSDRGRHHRIWEGLERKISNIDIREREPVLALAGQGEPALISLSWEDPPEPVSGDLGDEQAARRLFGLAVDSAEGLVNARPRALAVVAICRSMAQQRVALDDGLRSRLDALHDGLGTPW